MATGQAKSLLDRIHEGSFRPREHIKLLVGHVLDVKPPHRDPSPAMVRIWGRLRSTQLEARDADQVDVQRDLAVEFSRLATEYMRATEYRRMDPTKDVHGIAEVITANQLAREATA